MSVYEIGRSIVCAAFAYSGFGGSLANRVPSLRTLPPLSSASESLSESSNGGSGAFLSIGGPVHKVLHYNLIIVGIIQSMHMFTIQLYSFPVTHVVAKYLIIGISNTKKAMNPRFTLILLLIMSCSCTTMATADYQIRRIIVSVVKP